VANDSSKPRRQGRSHPPFERIVLLLQGGGALGAYQGGVYQGLAEAGIHPDWTAGISIGAINAAIIAGNPPERRVERLRQFWELVSSPYAQWQLPVTPAGAAAPNKDDRVGWDLGGC
jgi:NTE family protein